jgi:hypothetical protein
MEDRLRLQVELAGDASRLWVAVSPSAKISDLCASIAHQDAKVIGKRYLTEKVCDVEVAAFC